MSKIGEILTNVYNIPVLFVTANPRMLGSGIPGTIGFLAKPYDAETISKAVAYALDFQDNTRLPPPPFIHVFEQNLAG